jgi:hypothetical protein
MALLFWLDILLDFAVECFCILLNDGFDDFVAFGDMLLVIIALSAAAIGACDNEKKIIFTA